MTPEPVTARAVDEADVTALAEQVAHALAARDRRAAAMDACGPEQPYERDLLMKLLADYDADEIGAPDYPSYISGITVALIHLRPVVAAVRAEERERVLAEVAAKFKRMHESGAYRDHGMSFAATVVANHAAARDTGSGNPAATTTERKPQ